MSDTVASHCHHTIRILHNKSDPSLLNRCLNLKTFAYSSQQIFVKLNDVYVTEGALCK